MPSLPANILTEDRKKIIAAPHPALRPTILLLELLTRLFAFLSSLPTTWSCNSFFFDPPRGSPASHAL